MNQSDTCHLLRDEKRWFLFYDFLIGFNIYSEENHSFVQNELRLDCEKYILVIAMITSNATIPIAMIKMIAVIMRTRSVIGIRIESGSYSRADSWADGIMGIACTDP